MLLIGESRARSSGDLLSVEAVAAAVRSRNRRLFGGKDSISNESLAGGSMGIGGESDAGTSERAEVEFHHYRSTLEHENVPWIDSIVSGVGGEGRRRLTPRRC